jgi:hypothetical protein
MELLHRLQAACPNAAPQPTRRSQRPASARQERSSPLSAISSFISQHRHVVVDTERSAAATAGVPQHLSHLASYAAATPAATPASTPRLSTEEAEQGTVRGRTAVSGVCVIS